MKVYKIEGAKNTFALVSFLEEKNSLYNKTEQGKKDLADLAAKICADHQIQMDGCVFVFPSEDLDFSWEFFNSDGSEALMCGNAARAVSLWHYAYVNSKKEISYQTPAQVVNAEIIDHNTWTNSKNIELQQGEVRVWLKGAKLIAEDHGYKIYDSGVPHLCVFLNTNEFWDKNFDEIAREFFDQAKSLRFPKVLDKKGSNVTYVWGIRPSDLKSDTLGFKTVKAMSFERGVEGWTEACGTGAIAAAYFVKESFHQKLPILVQMPGGVLEIDESNGKTTLTGPAKILDIIELKDL